jgi:hypothetical protein
MSAARPGTTILGAVVATVVALWLSYAVAAGLMQSAQRASGAPQRPEAAPVGLALTPAPELRMRPALLKHAAAVRAIAQPAPASAPAPPPAAPPAARPAPAAMSAPPPPAATMPAPSAPARQAPAPRPTTTPAPAPKPQPTKPARPDFDDAAPSGFDTAG